MFFQDCRANVAKIWHCKFVKINYFAATGSRHSLERRTTVARQSRDSLAKYFGEKNSHKFFKHV